SWDRTPCGPTATPSSATWAPSSSRATSRPRPRREGVVAARRRGAAGQRALRRGGGDRLESLPLGGAGLARGGRRPARAGRAVARHVRRADRARRQPGAAAPFLLAAFHPLAGAPASPPADPNALVSRLRRTPDP